MAAPLRDPNNLIAIIYDWAARCRQAASRTLPSISLRVGRPCN